MRAFVNQHTGALIGAAATVIGAILVAAVVFNAPGPATSSDQSASSTGPAAPAGHARDVTITPGAHGGSVAEAIARGLAKAHRSRFEYYDTQLRDTEAVIAALINAVEALHSARNSADAPAAIDEALSRLETGDTATAEEIF